MYILDDFTLESLALEDNINLIPAPQSPLLLWGKKIDLLLVESAWLGNHQKWRHKIAKYENHLQRDNSKLLQLIDWAKKKKIPTVFWNKEDPFHFDQFIDSAKLFDFVFTTDSNTIHKYKDHLGHTNIFTLGFSFQPKIHYPASFSEIEKKSSIFIGSYNEITHPDRKEWQKLCFSTASQYGLTIVDRHAGRKEKNMKFPQYPNTIYLKNVPYNKTRQHYLSHQQSINVNTITDSPTMFSRRLLEIMACQRLVISNPTLATDQLFPNLYETIKNEEEADELFSQLSFGLNNRQKEMAIQACQEVFRRYTIKQWIKDILIQCNIDHPYLLT